MHRNDPVPSPVVVEVRDELDYAMRHRELVQAQAAPLESSLYVGSVHPKAESLPRPSAPPLYYKGSEDAEGPPSYQPPHFQEPSTPVVMSSEAEAIYQTYATSPLEYGSPPQSRVQRPDDFDV
jgi:hypothetical protein